MIANFKSKALEEVFKTSKSAKLPQERLDKIKIILAVIHSATALKDISNPSFRLHKLKKPPLRGWYSIDVSGNFRIVFRYVDGMVYDVDYLDTH